MRILCVLQNAWGDRRLPIRFVPNPYNKSAKVIRKMVGENYYEFANTTDVVTQTPNEKPKPNYQHFKRVIVEMKKFDLVLVCGNQAKEVVNKFIEDVKATNVPFLFVPHPAARNLSNSMISEIHDKIRSYER